MSSLSFLAGRMSSIPIRNRIAPAAFFEKLVSRGFDTFFGVPDTTLQEFSAFMRDHVDAGKHVITANEGNAVAMAAGYHLATGDTPVVYLQNSGIGSAMNPLLSLNHAEVYAIPALMLVGWRGGGADGPEHYAQGRLTPQCLQACEVPYLVIQQSELISEEVESALIVAQNHFRSNHTPFALLLKQSIFSRNEVAAPESAQARSEDRKRQGDMKLDRETAIRVVLGAVGSEDVVVCTTGMASRELFAIREYRKQSHQQDFLTLGSMGHCSSIAAGIALAHPLRNVWVLDGDGAAIMHMGSFATIGARKIYNLKHLVFNNGVHDSVGGDWCASRDISLTGVARACGYETPGESPAATVEAVVEGLKKLSAVPGPGFLEINVRCGSRADIPRRMSATPMELKAQFTNFLSPNKREIPAGKQEEPQPPTDGLSGSSSPSGTPAE